MFEVEPRMEGARELLTVDATKADAKRSLRRFKHRARERSRRKAVMFGAVASAAAGALVTYVVLAPTRTGPTSVPAIVADVKPAPEEHPSPRVVYFPDGSQAKLMKPKTQLHMEALSDDLLELTMANGEARFEVQPNQKRLFRVLAGLLRIEVLGTSFTVKKDAESTSVDVHEGRVAVYQGQNRHELGAGMSIEFEGTRAIVEGESSEPRAQLAEPRAKKKRRSRRRRNVEVSRPVAPIPQPVDAATRPRWRRLAKDGDFKGAYQALSQQEPREVEDETQDLMLAADVARLTGHPGEAVRYLERVVERHRDNPRALPAAFTLGRILRHEIGDPRRAAAAFRLAYELEPTGSLAEDALAHEVECWGLAGDKDEAQKRARVYVEQHPAGRKIRQVQRLGGL